MSTLYDKLLATFNKKLNKTTVAAGNNKATGTKNQWTINVPKVTWTAGGAVQSVSTADADAKITLCDWMPKGDLPGSLPSGAQAGWGLKLNATKTALEWGSLGGGAPTPIETGSGYTVYSSGLMTTTWYKSDAGTHTFSKQVNSNYFLCTCRAQVGTRTASANEFTVSGSVSARTTWSDEGGGHPYISIAVTRTTATGDTSESPMNSHSGTILSFGI